jgi:2-methylcitrate dehydratase
MAAAMVDKKITTDSFSDEKLKDPRIFEVIDKIKGEPSQEFEKMFPAKQPSRVVVTTNDGRTFEEYLEYPKGDPREPMTIDDLENKFNSLAGDKFDTAEKKQLKETIFNCEEMTASEFMESLNA